MAKRIEDEIADQVEGATTLREKARKHEDGAVAKLEKRLDDALMVEGAEDVPVKINLPFDEAIRRALEVAPPAEGWADERPRRRKGERKR